MTLQFLGLSVGVGMLFCCHMRSGFYPPKISGFGAVNMARRPPSWRPVLHKMSLCVISCVLGTLNVMSSILSMSCICSACVVCIVSNLIELVIP